jgi:hypothetical protein
MKVAGRKGPKLCRRKVADKQMIVDNILYRSNKEADDAAN